MLTDTCRTYGLIIDVTTVINPLPANAIAKPIIAYSAICFALLTFSGFAPARTKKIPATTNIKTANAPTTSVTKVRIFVIRIVKLSTQAFPVAPVTHKGFRRVTLASPANAGLTKAKALTPTTETNSKREMIYFLLKLFIYLVNNSA